MNRRKRGEYRRTLETLRRLHNERLDLQVAVRELRKGHTPALAPFQMDTLPIISITHLTQEVANKLEEEGDDNPWVGCAEWPYGMFIYVGGVSELENKPPKCLLDLEHWVKHQHRLGYLDDCCWVRLDGDAPQMEDLPVYEW